MTSQISYRRVSDVIYIKVDHVLASQLLKHERCKRVVKIKGKGGFVQSVKNAKLDADSVT